MKTLFKKLLLIISILLLLFVPWMRTWSCGPQYSPEDYRFVMFQPALSNAPALADLYYNNRLSYLRDGDPQKKDYNRNCREWQQVIGGKLSDIYNIQYGMEPDDFLYAYHHKEWERSKENSFLHALLMPANKPYLDYMAFAKQVEFNQFGEYDPWESGHDNGGQQQTVALLKEGKKAFGQTTNPFLKERYAFQLVKLMYYGGGDWDSLPAFYDTHLKGHRTIVADWAQLYYALCNHDKVTTTKLLCETWEKSEEKKAYIYGRLARTDLDTLIQQHPEMAAAWLIRGFKQPDRALHIIQAIHRISPQYQYLPMLVVREVNKVEDWVMGPRITGFNASLREQQYYNNKVNHDYGYSGPDTLYAYYAKKNMGKDLTYLRTLRSYLESIVSKSDSNHVIYALAVAHLYNMDGEYAKATAWLNEVQTSKNNLYRRQYIMEQLVAAMHTADIKSDAVKTDFAAQLNELVKRGAKTRNIAYDDDSVDNGFSFLLLMLSQQYEKQHDVITAGLLYQKANVLVNAYTGFNYDEDTCTDCYARIGYFDQHATPEEIDQLLQFKHAKKKSAFEKFITPRSWGRDDFLRDLKISLLVRQRRYREALAIAEQLDVCFWEDNYAYSAYLTRKYIGSPDYLVPGERIKSSTYPIASKRAVLRDIVALSDSLKRYPQHAALYYRMGNAMYNISFGGRCWMLANYGKGWGYEGNYYYGPGMQEYGRSALNMAYKAAYYKCETAMNMYNKALVYGQGQKELCAKVLLMMSVCERDRNSYENMRRYNDAVIVNNHTPDPVFNSRYLDILKKKYGNTQMYAESKMMCPDVK